ncbi:MAG: phosphoribosylformylglycinamidine synthase I [Rhodobacteraceae bacterium]|nr:phosphoribosylformylglycinamidine synthase I [Paracoccaceae bacterium]
MKAGVLVFPGSNCDRDLADSFQSFGASVQLIWHKESSLPSGLDIIGVPGGFSFGDYLRCGAIAANSPICRSLITFGESGGYILGICNGFQILTETGLLPGALIQNNGLKFLGKTVDLKVETPDSVFTYRYKKNQLIAVPIAHHEGNYTVAEDDLAALRDQDRVAFSYCKNPNGSVDDIAGILSSNRRILGMMPHPERAVDALTGVPDCQPFFAGLAAGLLSD